MITAYTPESPPLDAGSPTLAQVFALVALAALMAAAASLVIEAGGDGKGQSFVEAAASLMFAGWFAAAVSLQLAGVPWMSGGVVGLRWLVVCSLAVASLVLVVVGVRVDRTRARISHRRIDDDA